MQLGLGTAQFGMHYGIANAAGAPSRAEVAKILRVAGANQINILDTAPSYGDSQSALGENLSPQSSFLTVTKTPHFDARTSGKERAKLLEKSFSTSLAQLGCEQVYGLLVHNADDLLHDTGDALFEGMQKLKAAGKVQKLGVSAYRPTQISAIADRYPIDLIQVPMNVFDQRFLAHDFLEKLSRQGVEIHTRSAFLQGALLMHTDALPAHFHPWKSRFTAFAQYLQQKQLSPLAGALAFMAGIEAVDRVIIGTNSALELEQILDACKSTALPREETARFAVDNEALVNPALWPNV